MTYPHRQRRKDRDMNLGFKLAFLNDDVFVSFLQGGVLVLFFQRALRFWNQTATWRGSRPSSEASLSFFSDSSLCSLPKLSSRRVTCSSVSFLFLAPAPPDSPLLLFLRRRLGLVAAKNKRKQVHVRRNKHASLRWEKNRVLLECTNLVVVQFGCKHQGTTERWVAYDLDQLGG